MDTALFNLLSVVLQAATLLVVILGMLAALKQFRAARHSTWTQGFTYCVNSIQSEKARRARRLVFDLRDKSRPYLTPAELLPEERDSIEEVCQAFDVVGMMARWGMVPKEIILDSWCDSLRRLWPICERHVLNERERRKAPEFWDDFQWLAIQAEAFDQNRTNKIKKMTSLQTMD